MAAPGRWVRGWPMSWLMGGLAGGLVLCAGAAWAQTAIAVPAVLTQAEKALAPAGAARDVTLTGTVQLWRAGQPETGTVTLSAIRGGASEARWAVPSGAITEQWRRALSSDTSGDTLTGRGAKGLVTQPAGGSILMPGWAWFAPAQLLARMAEAGHGAADLGAEVHDGAKSEHLRVWRQRAGAPPLDQNMIDVYLDPADGLPSAMVFRIRPYVAPGQAAPPHVRPRLGLEEVRFSNYQTIAGRLVPLRIQAFMGAKPIFALTLAGATFNRGLTLAALQ